ncbi:MAG TPA: hypothetical protein VG796_08245 [Verrucomicrobiales bacterium]|nr:hypothetical protein [Verrucomicrobiales bacterium]
MDQEADTRVRRLVELWRDVANPAISQAGYAVFNICADVWKTP